MRKTSDNKQTKALKYKYHLSLEGSTTLSRRIGSQYQLGHFDLEM
jgi:hypothetical protein